MSPTSRTGLNSWIISYPWISVRLEWLRKSSRAESCNSGGRLERSTYILREMWPLTFDVDLRVILSTLGQIQRLYTVEWGQKVIINVQFKEFGRQQPLPLSTLEFISKDNKYILLMFMILTTNSDYFSKHHLPLIFLIQKRCIFSEVRNQFLGSI
jgi:hypothetical protein